MLQVANQKMMKKLKNDTNFDKEDIFKRDQIINKLMNVANELNAIYDVPHNSKLAYDNILWFIQYNSNKCSCHLL